MADLTFKYLIKQAIFSNIILHAKENFIPLQIKRTLHSEEQFRHMYGK